MPTINISRRYLERLVGKRMSEEVLLNRISMMGTAIEGSTKDELVIEIFPNRPDMLSVEGFARALSLFIGARKSLPKYSARKSGLRVNVEPSVRKVRPFIRCALVRNVHLDDDTIRSIMQVQEKLHQTHGRKRRRVAIGIHDFSRMKFPLTYKAVEPESISFVPLGESRPMNLAQILKRHPKGQQYAFILENESKYPILIDSSNNVMSFPPIINGELTAVTQKTKDIFIDITGTDELAVEQTLAIMVTTLADMGGIIYSVKSDNKMTPDLKWNRMQINVEYVNKLLGLSLKKSDLKGLLLKMGLGFDGRNVLIPPYRVDILHQFDLVEDIAIAYGYENFEPQIPSTSTIGAESQSEIFSRHISEIMVGFGFIEVSTYHLSNYTDIKTRMNYALPYVELANSVSSEYNILRPWMLPMLMKVLSENKTQAFPHRIFEIGTVFSPDSREETKVSERKMLAAAISDKNADFTKIRQVLDALMLVLGLKFELEPCEHQTFIAGRVASIVAYGETLGFIGEISPQVLTAWQLETPVAAFEIDAGMLKKLVEKNHKI